MYKYNICLFMIIINLNALFIHTTQHYLKNMNKINFFNDFLRRVIFYRPIKISQYVLF